MGDRVIDVFESELRGNRFNMVDGASKNQIASFFYEVVDRDARADTPWGHVAANGGGRLTLDIQITLDGAPFAEVHIGPMMMKYVIRFHSGKELTFKSWRLGTEYRYEWDIGKIKFKFMEKLLGDNRHLLRVSLTGDSPVDFERLVMVLLTTVVFMAGIGPYEGG